MPSAIRDAPQGSVLTNVIVGAPASGAIGRRWANDLGFLLGYNLPQVCSQTYKVPSGTTTTTKIPFRRHHGCKAILVFVELHPGTALAAECTLAVSVSSGSLSWIGLNPFNTTTHRPPHHILRDREPIVGWADVTSITVGATVDLHVTWTNTSSTQGIQSITVAQVPIAESDPTAAPSTEVGFDGTWPYVGNPIEDGSTTTGRGLIRVLGQLDEARSTFYRHWSLSTPEDTSNAWQVTSGSLAAVPFGMGSPPRWRVRPRALYGTSVSETTQFRVRYQTSTTNTGTLRVKVTPDGGSPSNTDISLAASAGAWTVKTQALTIPASGSNQECLIEFECSTTSGTLYISQLGWITNES